jgi:hypothetical protein
MDPMDVVLDALVKLVDHVDHKAQLKDVPHAAHQL